LNATNKLIDLKGIDLEYVMSWLLWRKSDNESVTKM